MVKYALHLSFIINDIFLKSFFDKFTELRYNVLTVDLRKRCPQNT
jgi:hypothetical protein